jgi:hypothetical protein
MSVVVPCAIVCSEVAKALGRMNAAVVGATETVAQKMDSRSVTVVLAVVTSEAG